MAIAPVATAAIELAPPARPLSNSAIVEKANAYFTHLNTLVADFTQVGGDGRRVKGTLFLQRPGRVRFEYDPPATLQVIADGRSVAVRDRKLATQDLYSISQTPLKFLLRERVNLGQDIRITGIANDGDSVRINLEDSSTLGGTSRITLYFDSQVEILNQWRIVDAQGFQTVVMLDKVERGRRIDQDMFKIQYEAILGNSLRQSVLQPYVSFPAGAREGRSTLRASLRRKSVVAGKDLPRDPFPVQLTSRPGTSIPFACASIRWAAS